MEDKVMLKLSQKAKDIYWLYRQMGRQGQTPLTYKSNEAKIVRRLLDYDLIHGSPLHPTHIGKKYLIKADELTKKYKAGVFFEPELHLSRKPKWRNHGAGWFVCLEDETKAFLHNKGFSMRASRHFVFKVTNKYGNIDWDAAMKEAYKKERPIKPMQRLFPIIYQTSSPDESGFIWLISKDWKVKLPIDERFYYLVTTYHSGGKFFGQKGFHHGNRILYTVNKRVEAFIAPVKRDAVQVPDFKSFKR